LCSTPCRAAQIGRMAVLRLGHHALHLGLHHHPVDDDGVFPNWKRWKKEGEAGAQGPQPVHPLFHRGAGDGPGLRHRHRAGAFSVARTHIVIHPGFFFRHRRGWSPLTGGTMLLMWIGRADHQPRPSGKWHFADHLRRHRGAVFPRSSVRPWNRPATGRHQSAAGDLFHGLHRGAGRLHRLHGAGPSAGCSFTYPKRQVGKQGLWWGTHRICR